MAEEKGKDATKLVVAFGTTGRVKTGVTKWLSVVLAAIALGLAACAEWNMKPCGVPMDDARYAYLTLACFLPVVLFNIPLRKKSPMDRAPWYDWLMAVVGVVCFVYLAIHSMEIRFLGWETDAPIPATVMVAILLVIMLSLAHRIFGTVFFAAVLVLSFYPLYARWMPGILFGISMPWRPLINSLGMGPDGLIGLPMRYAAKIIISLTPFIVGLLYLGGGKFFINLALSIIGTFRGGAAKVAVLSSALVASITGGGVSNVLTTGVVTIPAMKKTGYAPHYAGAIEACASQAGGLTPPIMGSAAFLMASFLRIPYWQICVSAVVPVLLYYISLFSQVDLYAKVAGLKGLPREELPSFWKTLKGGWFFLVALFFLIYLMGFANAEGRAGFFAGGALLAMYSLSGGKERLKALPKDIVNLLLSIAKRFGSIIILFGVVGLIIAGVNLTGMALALSGGIIGMSGGNLFLLLLLGAFAAYIMGMGMTPAAVYAIVSILVAPALTDSNLNRIASHLFVLYWGMMASITPPVAFSAMVASKLAGAPFFKTAFTADRLGIGLFILPFFFVMSPVLVLQEVVISKLLLDFTTCALGLVLISCALQGSIYFLKGTIGIPMRLLVFASGFLLAVPAVANLVPWVRLSDYIGAGVGIISIALYILWQRLFRRSEVVA